jgi:hypothetical protein
MRLSIPPIVPYVFGAILVVFGIVRAKYLGAPRTPRASVEDEAAAQDAPPERGPAERRHLRWGVIYVAMGLFLIISTYVQLHRGR